VLRTVPLSDFRNVRGCAFDRSLVIALLIRTSNYRSVFAKSLHQVLMSAIRTLLRDRLRRRSEFALRIISAAVKSIALTRAFFDEFPFFAFGALYSDEVLLHEFALGISAAGSELAETAVPQDQVAFAQRAGFIERNVGHSLALIEPPRRLAIGIAGAGHELAEAPALQDHDAATVFAVFLLRGLLYIG